MCTILDAKLVIIIFYVTMINKWVLNKIECFFYALNIEHLDFRFLCSLQNASLKLYFKLN